MHIYIYRKAINVPLAEFDLIMIVKTIDSFLEEQIVILVKYARFTSVRNTIHTQ